MTGMEMAARERPGPGREKWEMGRSKIVNYLNTNREKMGQPESVPAI
jgi:hypothetical protein